MPVSRNDTPGSLKIMKRPFTDMSGLPLQLPARLRPGSTIGVAAPAGPFDRDQFTGGLKVFEAAGFHIHAPADLFTSSRYLAGSDQHRAETVNRLFADPSIDAVICARGGFGSMRALPHLDFDLIARQPERYLSAFQMQPCITDIPLRPLSPGHFSRPGGDDACRAPQRHLMPCSEANRRSDPVLTIRLRMGRRSRPARRPPRSVAAIWPPSAT